MLACFYFVYICIMTKDLFNRYIWLVDTIYRAGRISFEEINQRWRNSEMSGGEDMALRTFHHHRHAIEEIFDINIECDKRNGYCYFIENADDIEKGGIRNWLLNTFAVNNLINESHHLKHRILFEQIPSCQKFLTPIIEAMRDSTVISITYQSFWNDCHFTFVLEPYCVKIFKQRWYMLANNYSNNKLLIFSLDRILSLTPTEQHFTLPADFDAQEFFSSCFGIIVEEDKKIETVRLIVYGNQYKYIRSLPLHHSQNEIETDKNMDFKIFEYQLRPSFDFVKEILSYGDEIEVESPSWLRDIVANITHNASMLYRE